MFSWKKRPKAPHPSEEPQQLGMACSHCECDAVGMYQWTDGTIDGLCGHDMAFVQVMLTAIDNVVEAPSV